MKIVDRKTFLALPAGVFYSKYEPHCFDELEIKGTTLGNDFTTEHIVHFKEYGGEFFEYRDGLFDADQLFAVWGRPELEFLIFRLQEALPLS